MPMTAADLIAEVARITQSPDHTDDDILALLNRCVLDIAGGGERQHGNALLAPLPGLFTQDQLTIDAGDSFTAMPDDYHRSLVRVSYLGEKMKWFRSHIKFLDEYEDTTGQPSAYCIKGSNLWVGPVPSSAAEVTVYYHRIPADMAQDDDTPDGIPVHLQNRLLVNYACREIYGDIEQGLEAASPDYTKHDALYQKALTDLERFIGSADGEPTNIDDEYYAEDNVL